MDILMAFRGDKKNEKDLVAESEEMNLGFDTKGIIYSDTEAQILLFVKERYDKMATHKRYLGINEKCDLYDRLYTPHRLNALQLSRDFDKNAALVDNDYSRKSAKSKPIAFEKVQTALATVIKENPRAMMKAASKRYTALNEIVKAAYEHNWDENRLLIELRKFVFHMAKYGVAYGRRYLKKEYKIIHNGTGKERIVKFYDSVWETLHPKHVILDETCDNPRNARDLFIAHDYTINQLKDMYPVEMFPRIAKVTEGRWLTEADKNVVPYGKGVPERQGLYEHLIYENVYKDVKLIIVNGVLISGPDDELPAHQLSVFGDKWAEKDESYDGIGICEILENYQPLVDDVANADIDLVREVIRPKLFIGSGMEVSDEALDEVDGQKIVKFNGDIGQLSYQRPTRTADATQLLDFMNQEIDDATGIARDLSAISDAKTLGQASFNRENSLRRLSLPLDSIKNAIEDDAEKALPLFKILHKEPLKTYIIEDQAELLEAAAIIKQFPEDERFVVMPDGKIARRLFREAELPVKMEDQAFVPSEERAFWELIPTTFDWKGKINIIPMSFLGESQAMEQEAAMQDLNILFPVVDVEPTTGQPTLIDDQGKAYKINRVKLLQDYLRSRRKDPDDYLLELTPMNVAAPVNEGQPMTNPANLQPTQTEKALNPTV